MSKLLIVSKATNIYNSEPENRLTVKISNDMNFLSQRYIWVSQRGNYIKLDTFSEALWNTKTHTKL